MTSEGRGSEAAPLRVLVDATSLSDAAQFRGIGTYTRELLRALGKRSDLHVRALAIRTAELPAGVSRVPILRLAPGRWAAREHAALLPFDIARATRRAPVDVVHSPSVHSPRWSHSPRVQTVCDVPAADGEGNYEALARSVRRAHQVVCISEDTGRAASRAFGVETARLSVAPLCLSNAFRPGLATEQAPFILFVGEYDPRKRHDLAIQVHNRLLAKGHAVRLRFIGRVAPWFAEQWANILRGSKRPDLVSVEGYVPVEELRDAYRSAVALLVTSDHEGFGLPALEAMACGSPVVAFASGATAEVVGDGGRLAEPGDVGTLDEAIEELLIDPRRRADLSIRALARAATFSWERCADLHVAAYRAAAATRRR